MSPTLVAAPHHTYYAPGHEGIVLSEVDSVLCVLLPRAFMVAGLSGEGQVLTVRYNSYDPASPEWDIRFFEEDLMDEPLLGVPQQVKAVFVQPDAAMLIPSPVYNDEAAAVWLQALHGTCPGDVVRSWAVASAGAQYAFALPAAIDKLLRRVFGHTPLLPVAAYQFYKPAPGVHYQLQCLITGREVVASLHQAGALQWHQTFAYKEVEDIAWQAAQLCRELHIPRIDLQVDCTLLCDECYDLLPELERFFPKIKWSAGAANDAGRWAPAVYLLQQLYACAL